MINVTLFKTSDGFSGFSVEGHSGYSNEGSDIVCAAVSSAAYLTANTVTDVLNIDADVEVSEGDNPLFYLRVKDVLSCKTILDGFALHIVMLGKSYPDYISVKECS